MKVCDPHSLSRPEPIEGFDGWIVSRPFQEEFQKAICLAYPSTGWQALRDDTCAQSQGDRISGHVELRSGVPLNNDDGGADPLWRTLLLELTSDEYDSALGAQLPADLSSTRKEIRLVRYGAGSFLGPHFDNQPEKVLTQILWPNLHWPDAWGGHLELLGKRSNDSLQVLRAITPLIERSVVTLATPKALHRVSAVKPCAASPRQTIIVEWYRS